MNASSRAPDEPPVRFDLLTENPVYKPFRYPWAYEAWLTQQRVHWLPEEVPLADDVKDWHRNLTAAERNLLSQIFRFFTQADVEVNNCYMKHYSQVFKPTEVLMMLSAFSNIETVHIAAYSHLLDTIGMPEIEYQAFLKYKEMKDKYDYMQSFTVDSQVRDRQDAGGVRRVHRGAAAVRLIRHPAEFPALREDEGDGPDHLLVGARRDAALHLDDPAVPHLRAGKPGDLDRGPEARHLPDLRHDRGPRGCVHRPRVRAGLGGGADCARGQGIHPLHRRPPADAAWAEPAVTMSRATRCPGSTRC